MPILLINNVLKGQIKVQECMIVKDYTNEGRILIPGY